MQQGENILQEVFESVAAAGHRRGRGCASCQRQKEMEFEDMEMETGIGGWIQDAVRKAGQFAGAAALLGKTMADFSRGAIHDETDITNTIFYGKYPQYAGKKIPASDKNAAADWLRIRKDVVRPVFGNIARQAGAGVSACTITNRIAFANRNLMKQGKNGPFPLLVKSLSPRKLANIDGIVLHQMAFSRGNDLNRYNEVGAHYIVMHDGKIGQLFENTAFLNASNGFNSRTVAIEFAGHFPDENYNWWKGNSSRTLLTPAQLQAGRCLVKQIKADVPSVKHIYAHRQSSGDRSNDPGPDIWLGVGQWAISQLGLSDVKNGVAQIGNGGQAVPAGWRKGRAI
ncbi:peptidoglycan recognition protein family protein [Chitinophaga lutea]